MSLRGFALALVGLVLSGFVHAAGTCYQWRANAVGPWTISPTGSYVDTVAAAVQDAANACEGAGSACMPSCGNGQYADQITIKSITPGTFPVFTAQVTVSCSSNGYSSDRAVTLVNRTSPEGCPDCSVAGTQTSVAVDSSVEAGDLVCGANKCLYEINTPSRNIVAGPGMTTGYSNVASAVSKGTACAATAAGSETEDEGMEGQCIGLTGGGAMCYGSNGDPTGMNCGTFNGDEVCVTNVPKGSCVEYSSGGVACKSASGTGSPAAPPAPDNGTPGSPANETGHVSTGAGDVYYYNSSTVAASSDPVTTGEPTSGEPEGTCSAGYTYVDGECVQDGSASGGGSCDAPPSCSGDAIQCAILQQQWKARCPDALSDSELQAAVGSPDMPSSTVDLPGSLSESGPIAISGASCPAAPTITVFGSVIELTWITYLCSFAAQVSALVMVAAYLTAAKILIGWGQA